MTPTIPEPTVQDLQQLDYLSAFHYVVAAMAAVFGLFPVLHLVVGLTLLVAPDAMLADGNSHTAFPFPIRLFGLFFALIPGMMVLAAQTFAVTVAIAGRRLKAHSHYSYCLVMAAIACAFMPFGTVLGVFTLIVLSRPGVKTLFGVEQPCQF